MGVSTFKQEASTPSTPSAGYVKVYVKTDDLVYKKTSAGVETLLVGIPSIVSSTDNALVRWDGTSGNAVQNSNATLSDAGALSLASTISASNFSGSSSGTNTGDVTIGTANGLSLLGQAISLALSSGSTTGALSSSDWTTFNGKLSNVLTTTGDLIYSSSGSTASRLPIGTEGYVLKVSGGLPAWIVSAAQAKNELGASDVVSVTATPHTPASTTYIFNVTTASLAITINLPDPALRNNYRINDISGNAETNNITLNRFGSETIEGVAANKILQTNYGGWDIFSDGTNWVIL